MVDLDVELPADASAPSRARAVLRAWLQRICVSRVLRDTTEELIYAVSEAVSNAADHAYPDHAVGEPDAVVTLRAHATADGPPRELPCQGPHTVHIVVTDHGRWRPPPDEPTTRGRGFTLIDAFVDDKQLETGPDGTTLTMHRSLRCSAVDAC